MVVVTGPLAIILSIINWLIDAYMAVLFIRLILDWVAMLTRWQPRGFVFTLVDAVYWLTEPPLKFLRRYIRPIMFGSFGLDLSFIVLWFALILLQQLI